MSQHENIVDTLSDELTFLREQKEILQQRENDLRAAILSVLPDQRCDHFPDQPDETEHLGCRLRAQIRTQNTVRFPDALIPETLRQNYRYHRSVVSNYVRMTPHGQSGGHRFPR